MKKHLYRRKIGNRYYFYLKRNGLTVAYVDPGAPAMVFQAVSKILYNEEWLKLLHKVSACELGIGNGQSTWMNYQYYSSNTSSRRSRPV